MMNSIKIEGSFEENFIEDEITSLEKVLNNLEDMYGKARKTM